MTRITNPTSQLQPIGIYPVGINKTEPHLSPVLLTQSYGQLILVSPHELSQTPFPH